MDVASLDALPEDAFVAAVAPWFEGAPRFLGRLARARPFGDESTLFDRAREIALAMPEDEQLELIDAHPRLGAPPASVSAASFRGQGYDRETTAAIEDLTRLNAAYEARFGFRFCVFVNGRSRPELVPALEAALGADRDAEIRRALADVVAIARDRSATARAIEEVRA
jgi:2-oxo-4-hydroxy-4-carboxy-5-ureidoimidazoline decarboxylase